MNTHSEIITLTDKFIREVPRAASKYRLYCDTECAGLLVYVGARRKTFYLAVSGTRVRIGPTEWFSVDKARKRAEKIKADRLAARHGRSTCSPRLFLTAENAEELAHSDAPVIGASMAVKGLFLRVSRRGGVERGEQAKRLLQARYLYTRACQPKEITIYVGSAWKLDFETAVACAKRLQTVFDAASGLPSEQVKSRLVRAKNDFFNPRTDVHPAWAA